MNNDNSQQQHTQTEREEEENGRGGAFAVSENFGLLLKHYRVKVKDMTLKQLEEACQVSSSYLNRIERGERLSPSWPTVIRIAESLEIPYSLLLATTFQIKENQPEQSLADLLIRDNYFINGKLLNKEIKSLLVMINEFILEESEWSSQSKIHDLYRLSEMIDELKMLI
ncbi:helix-turn-helix domain-containing protein [Paenibacillus sp. FSL L8-0709]|uniref:helix-turn-helix domain-containing protein n=1 Tax=Paenibacillus sp. FSL L8-0709 TaxID=2975312 RepID=UPI0030FBC536